MQRRAEVISTTVIALPILLVTFVMPLVVPMRLPEQIVMGTVVNCALVIAALRSRYVYAIVFLPSIVHVINFYAFSIGTLSIIPAIWVGNIVIVLCFRYIKSFGIASITGILLKAIIIGTLTVMTFESQIIVGVLGCLMAYLIHFSSKYVVNKSAQ